MLLTLVGLLVFMLAYVSTLPIIPLAWSIGAVDVPCDWRRMHRERIPRAGGLSIYLAFALGVVTLGAGRAMAPLLIGGAAMLLLGLLDDVFCLRAGLKLALEIPIVTGTLLFFGVVSPIRLGLSVLWILALVNAHNMIDGLDGLLSGCAAIEGVALSLFFLLSEREGTGAYALLLAMACLGFRVWNRYPARIFAGDAGSTFVGFALGVLSLRAFERPITGRIPIAPLLIFAYPLTDLGTSVLRRLLRGQHPFEADRAHLHHRITAVGLTHVQGAGVLLTLCAGLGLIGVFLGNEIFLPAAFCACMAGALLLPMLRSYIMDFV